MSLGVVGYGNDFIVPVYAYALPCAAELLLEPDTSGVKTGARTASLALSTAAEALPTGQQRYRFGPLTLTAAPQPHPSGPGGRQCTVQLGDTTQQHSSCALRFAGDLNQDGQPDFAWESYGEMGCGAWELWLSQPDGSYALAQRRLWDC